MAPIMFPNRISRWYLSFQKHMPMEDIYIQTITVTFLLLKTLEHSIYVPSKNKWQDRDQADKKA